MQTALGSARALSAAASYMTPPSSRLAFQPHLLLLSALLDGVGRYQFARCHFFQAEILRVPAYISCLLSAAFIRSRAGEKATMPIDIELCFARPAKQTATLFGRVFPTLSYQDACTACTNFDYDVASQMYLGREELWLSTPSLGPYPDAFKSVQFHTRFEEVIEQADAGCPSCVLLREAVLALSYGSLKVQSAVDLQIVYCRPYTMTIDIMERPANLDESDAPAWQMKVRSGENKMVNFQIELFTLPGRWPLEH